MVHAFVMIETGAGQSATVRDTLLGVEGITEAHVVAGEYDLIVEMDVEEIYDVLHTISVDVQDLRGIDETKTYISLS